MTGTVVYFGVEGGQAEKRCVMIVSKSGKLDGYDFVFEWFTEPKKEGLDTLTKKVS
jgi:hypothetical protein